MSSVTIANFDPDRINFTALERKRGGSRDVAIATQNIATKEKACRVASVLAEVMLSQPGGPLASSGKQVSTLSWDVGRDNLIRLAGYLKKHRVVGSCSLDATARANTTAFSQVRMIGGFALWHKLPSDYKVPVGTWDDILQLPGQLQRLNGASLSRDDLRVIESACNVWSTLYADGLQAPIGLIVPGLVAKQDTFGERLIRLNGNQLSTFYSTNQTWDSDTLRTLGFALEQLKLQIEGRRCQPVKKTVPGTAHRDRSRHSSRSSSRASSAPTSPTSQPVIQTASERLIREQRDSLQEGEGSPGDDIVPPPPSSPERSPSPEPLSTTMVIWKQPWFQLFTGLSAAILFGFGLQRLFRTQHGN